MLETLLGGALGAVTRLAPEVLKFLDRNGERKHELSMIDKNLQAERQKAELHIQEITAQDVAAQNAGDLQALLAGVAAQGVRTGVAWVDGLNQLVRPFLTFYWCVGLYTAVMVCRWTLLKHSGLDAGAALLHLWGPNEEAIVASMLAYWFVDRSLRKGGGVGAPH